MTITWCDYRAKDGSASGHICPGAKDGIEFDNPTPRRLP